MTNVVIKSWRLTAYCFRVLSPVSGGGTIFIAYLGVEGPFYWQLKKVCIMLLGNFGRLVEFFLFMSITMQAVAVGCSFALWSKRYLKGWSFRSGYFICTALRGVGLYLDTHSYPKG